MDANGKSKFEKPSCGTNEFKRTNNLDNIISLVFAEFGRTIVKFIHEAPIDVEQDLKYAGLRAIGNGLMVVGSNEGAAECERVSPRVNAVDSKLVESRMINARLG